MNIYQMYDLARLSLALGRVNRATFHEDGVTPESGTDHTVMLILVACEAAKDFGLDVGLTAQMAAVHDLPEAIAGDTDTLAISERDRRRKAELENYAIRDLEETFGSDSWVIKALHSYERQESRESQLVRILDKVLPKLTHTLNGGVAIKAKGMSVEDLMRAHEHQFNELRTRYPTMAYDVFNWFQVASIDSEYALGEP